MVNISIDVTDLGGEAHPGDKVIFWRPRVGGSATHAGRVISTAPHTVLLEDGTATVPDVEPGEMRVLLQCRGFESQEPIPVVVPDSTGVVTLRALIESQFEYSPPIVSAVQQAADNAAASERNSKTSEIRSKQHADRAESIVDDAIANGAAMVRDEVKQDADRAVSARQAAAQSETNAKASENAAASSASSAKTSETNAKQSEDNAGDFAAVATTAATEAVGAMERATDLAGGDFATREYVDDSLTKALSIDTTVGTRVFAGDQMIYGDTGRRVLASWDKSGVITGDMPTGLAPISNTDGYVVIRRENNLVTLYIRGGQATGGTVVVGNLPLGYSAHSDTWEFGFCRVGTIHVAKEAMVRLGQGHVTITGIAAGDRFGDSQYHVVIRWATSDIWPGSLIGNPA